MSKQGHKDRNELKVFIILNGSKCSECGEDLPRSSWITLADDRVLCLSCADMDHLVYLPARDAALTRRARKHGRFSAVVLKWSRARKRYERQGIVVDVEGLEKAEAECLADEDVRARRREREAGRREQLDQAYVSEFASHVRRHYPSCPEDRAAAIAEHACLKYSGRVGRSEAAKAFDPEAVRLAVVAHVRHTETEYGELLGGGVERRDARRMVQAGVDDVLAGWASGPSGDTTG